MIKQLSSNIMTSKIKKTLFIFYRLFSCTLVARSITIINNNFSPIFEIIFRMSWKNSSLKYHWRIQNIRTSIFSFRSLITAFECHLISCLTAPRSSFEINENFIWITRLGKIIRSWTSIKTECCLSV